MRAPDPEADAETIRDMAGPSASGIVLQVASAHAVLLTGVSADAGTRTRVAENALRASSGRGDLTIGRRSSGRPVLQLPYPELAVSLSHRDDLMCAAFSPTAVVGVDIELEPADPSDFDPVRLARDHFTPGEAAAIAALPLASALDLFLRVWVAKEAALKITGRGIYDGLDEPDLTSHLAALLSPSAEIAMPAGKRLPAFRVAVLRVQMHERPSVYCGLAVTAK